MESKPQVFYDWTAHRSLSFILIPGKLFAIFPLEGIGNAQAKDLAFRWKSPGAIYSVAFLVISLILIGFQLNWVYRNTVNSGKLCKYVLLLLTLRNWLRKRTFDPIFVRRCFL